jgi:hypothetical protein
MCQNQVYFSVLYYQTIGNFSKTLEKLVKFTLENKIQSFPIFSKKQSDIFVMKKQWLKCDKFSKSYVMLKTWGIKIARIYTHIFHISF